MRILFISDLHLHSSRPELTRALLTFLSDQASHCDRLYILGDLFEAWIGDDAIPPDQLPVIEALRQLSDRGIPLYFQHGNRDFLIGDKFAELTGCVLLEDAEVIDLPSGPALLMHGDQLCTDDAGYQQLRRQLRDKQWQRDFLARPVTERLAIAQQLRDASKEKSAEKDIAIMDVNSESVDAALADAGVTLLIHGHTHRPASHALDQTRRRIVLGDWDQTGWYLEATEQGEALVEFTII